MLFWKSPGNFPARKPPFFESSRIGQLFPSDRHSRLLNTLRLDDHACPWHRCTRRDLVDEIAQRVFFSYGGLRGLSNCLRSATVWLFGLGFSGSGALCCTPSGLMISWGRVQSFLRRFFFPYPVSRFGSGGVRRPLDLRRAPHPRFSRGETVAGYGLRKCGLS